MGERAFSPRTAGAGAKLGLAVGAGVACAMLIGCTPTEPLPHRDDSVPPLDGELLVYDVLTADGTPYGRTAKRWNVTDGGLEIAGGDAAELARDAPADSAVVLDPKTREVKRAWKGSGDARLESTWDAARGVVVMKGPGVDETISVPAGTRDNDEMLESLRFAGLAPGRSLRGAIFNRGLRAWIPVQIDVLGETHVDTPSGRYHVIDHRVGFGTQYHHAFIEVNAPHRLVRYDNAAGSTLALRSYRASKHDEGPIETAPIEVPKAKPKLANVVTTLLVQWPLMIGLPMLLAFRLRKQMQLPWSVWGWGALGFALSQMIHIPLNWALGLMGSLRAVGMASPPVVAAALGLSAGLCEEVVRWLVLRRLARRSPEPGGGHGLVRTGLVAGAGHGGVEALIFGCLTAATAISMWTVPYLPPSWVGIPPEARDAFAKQLLLYWSGSWEGPIFGGVERVSAMIFHIGMSVLIARGIERGRALAYVAVAVLAHAAFDGAVVYAAPRVSMVVLEGVTLAASLVIGALVVRALRQKPA